MNTTNITNITEIGARAGRDDARDDLSTGATNVDINERLAQRAQQAQISSADNEAFKTAYVEGYVSIVNGTVY